MTIWSVPLCSGVILISSVRRGNKGEGLFKIQLLIYQNEFARAQISFEWESQGTQFELCIPSLVLKVAYMWHCLIVS